MIARFVALLAAFVLLGVTHPVPPAKLASLVSHHPLYPLLAEYDREIAALRATESMPGLAQISSDTARSSANVRAAAAHATQKVSSIATAHGVADQTREASAIARLASAGVLSTQDARNRVTSELAAYRDELARQTNTMLTAFRASIAQRTQRALAARALELHERESAFAFDLARQNAGTQLDLRLKLQYLHLDEESRSPLETQLSTLRAGDAARIEAMRRADTAALAAYQSQLERAAATDIARMTHQLNTKAATNLSLRRSILAAETAAPANALPTDLPSRAAMFRKNYDFAANATSIESGFSQANADISRRFTTLKVANQSSRAATDAQIAALEADRETLYRTIVSDVTR